MMPFLFLRNTEDSKNILLVYSCIWSNQMLQHVHDWAMYFCSFSINFILNSLLHFLKLFQLCSLLTPQHFLALRHFLPSPWGQVPATSQPPQTMSFCRCLHDYINLAQSCYSKQSCFLVLIYDELESLMVLFFYLNALMYGRFIPQGLCSSQL